jgi:predicted PurR-regulated permease PerM
MISRAMLPVELPPRLRAQAARENANAVLRWTLLVLAFGAFLAVRSLWAPVLLAAWTAILAQPLHAKLAARVHGRGGAAAVITVLLVLVALVPLLVVGLSLFGAAVDLAESLQKSGGVPGALKAFVVSEPSLSVAAWDAQRVFEMARQHGSGAVTAASRVFGAAATIIIGLFVFVFGFYTFLIKGRVGWAWLLDNSPLPRQHLVRLGNAFVETGRGLFIGVGLTALIQGAIATTGYLLIGVPQGLVLGLLTAFAALIPSIGTGLVWVPVAVALYLSGNTGGAIAMAAVGCFISLIDNFIRPALSRYGHLQLNAFVVLIAMLGGITAFGTWGLLLGPLLVRLVVEGVEIWHDVTRPPTVEDAPPLA